MYNESDRNCGNIGGILLLIALGIFVFANVSITKVLPTEVAFVYNVANGQKVNPTNCPLLSKGWHIVLGWNKRVFKISGEVNDFSFTSEKDSNSPFDESLNWDSSQGATMVMNHYTILGQVTNPWKFYHHYSQSQINISGIEGISDSRIYEAIREAGDSAAANMGELTQEVGADEIQKHPKQFSEDLTKKVASYMNQFGFTVKEVIFNKKMTYPNEGGRESAIEQGRSMISQANSQLEQRKVEVKLEREKKTALLSDAQKKAKTILGEADRKANALSSEASALAEQFRVSVEKVGAQGAFILKMTEFQAELIEKGVISTTILTGDSSFGQIYYPPNLNDDRVNK